MSKITNVIGQRLSPKHFSTDFGAASEDEPASEYRAYDTTTEWSGPARATVEDAQRDADRHNEGCARQGGYGSAIVATRDGDRLAGLDGAPIWPPHGRSTGAARWR